MNSLRQWLPTWIPPTGRREAIATGLWWDAIRTSAEIGYQVLEVLRHQIRCTPGPVIADLEGREPHLYFLVRRSTAHHWSAPGSRALGKGWFVVVPSHSLTAPPGPHWTVPPCPDEPWSTSPRFLCLALHLVGMGARSSKAPQQQPLAWKARMSRSEHRRRPEANSAEVTSSTGEEPRDHIFTLNLRHALHILNGEWIPDVLVALADGPKQYTGLLGIIREKTREDGWSETRHLYLQESVLNRTLRRLEREELVERHREPTFPYRARYQLTSAANELLTALTPLTEWPKHHADLVSRAQQAGHREQ
ncbi:hypothetical protein D3C57_109110 [Streptomyces rapamycinicus NRRL 5491]|uniref:HTH hxlR-type domain-containing protein n=2 Tax=Streptomyces rapamycinicus TaxID=1226757 RepID=A0A3L8RFK2_STRRN|nr:hypothetical protein D3C57_109110 [Streptomyces rapamycinicus NRRL 5491]